jgi:hypothetical protein
VSQLAQTRPRSITEIIDASFRFYRARFGDLMVVSALLLVPPTLLSLLAPGRLGLPMLGVGVLMFLAGQGAVAILVAASVEQDQSLSGGAALRRLGRRWGNVALVAIVSALLTTLGFAALVIPGFIALAWTATAVPSAAIEELSLRDALDRSRALARGRVGHVLGTLSLVWLILAVLFFGLMVVVTTVIMMDSTRPVLFILALLMRLVRVPVFPLIGVVSTLLYYDLRVRSEGADVAAMIEALPVPPAEPA